MKSQVLGLLIIFAITLLTPRCSAKPSFLRDVVENKLSLKGDMYTDMLFGFLDKKNLKNVQEFLAADEMKEITVLMQVIERAAEESSEDDIISNIVKAVIKHIEDVKAQSQNPDLVAELEKVRFFISFVYDNFDKYVEVIQYNIYTGHPFELLTLAYKINNLIDKENWYQAGVESANVFDLLLAPIPNTTEIAKESKVSEHRVLNTSFNFSSTIREIFNKVIKCSKKTFGKLVYFLHKIIKFIKRLF